MDINQKRQAVTVVHEGATTVHSYELEAEFTGKDPLIEVSAVFTSVTVYPEEGNFPAVARALLGVADHPSQVRSVSHPRAGFEVPAEVFARFEADQPTQQSSNGQEPPAGEPESRKRRPGRPRKEPLLTPEELAAAVAAGTPDDASKEE